MPKEDAKTLAIVALLLIIVVLTHSLVRVENQRYAMEVGFCPAGVDFGLSLHDKNCLNHVETRTGWYWHVYYAVFNPEP